MRITGNRALLRFFHILSYQKLVFNRRTGENEVSPVFTGPPLTAARTTSCFLLHYFIISLCYDKYGILSFFIGFDALFYQTLDLDKTGRGGVLLQQARFHIHLWVDSFR